MSPYLKAALFTIRLIAFGMILFSAMMLAPEVFRWLAKGSMQAGGSTIILCAIPFLAGVVIWLKSYRLARFLTKDFDE